MVHINMIPLISDTNYANAVAVKLFTCHCLYLSVFTLCLIYTVRSVHFILLHSVSLVFYKYIVRCINQLISKSYYLCTS